MTLAPAPLVRACLLKRSLRRILIRGRLGPRTFPASVPGPIGFEGLRLVKITPLEPTAAQKATVGQEAAKNALNGCPRSPTARCGIRLVADHELLGPVGSLETATSPLLVTARQRS